MAKLRITDENGKERIHELIDDVTTIGRASANTIQITDEKASRNHFRVDKAGDRYKVVDLGSTNGTRLNGQKVAGEAYLRAGDQMSLGKTTFVYDGPGAPAPAGEPSTSLSNNASKDNALTLPLDPKDNKPVNDGPKYVLKVIEGKDPGKLYELGAAALTLGRHSSNTIQIIDDAASNYHAEVNREPMGFVLTDLGSTNGTRVKSKNKTDFEKVIKTPLTAGMQIRVGKTVLEFENVGKPDDDAMFGTIALDPENLESKLTDTRSRGMPKALVGALLAMVFLGVVGAIVFLNPAVTASKGSGKKLTPVDTSNKIVNGDFSEGTDDEGNPKNFKVERGAQGVKAEVVAEADYSGKAPEPPPADPAAPKPAAAPKLGLRISKAGKSASALTSVETASTISLDPGKVYELGGWMRNDGDGLFGLRVVWIAGEQKLPDNLIVLKDTQEWKEKSITVTPPPWAQRAKVGVFVQGKDGKACFDNLRFREKPDGEAAPHLAVKYGAIGVTFEGTKGMFSGTSQGERVLEDGTLLLVSPDDSAVSDLVSAVTPQVTKEATKAGVAGQIYDFALQELTNYSIEAQQAGSGVELRLAVDSANDNASRPRLRFFVVGPAAQGDVEVSKSGASERMQASENSKTFSGIEEILFNAGKMPQFDLVFSKPVDVEIRREGNRRNVTISFKGQLQVGLAPESVIAKQQMIAAAGELKNALVARRWNDAEKQLAVFRTNYASKFQQATEEISKAQAEIDGAWRNTQDEVRRTIESLQLLKAPGAGKAARDTINRHILAWNGTERATELQDKLKFIDEWEKTNENAKAEQDAENMYKQAELYFNNKVYGVAISILKVKIINDPVNKNTKAADKAKELLPKAEAAEQRQNELSGIQTRLRDKIKNYILTNDIKSAIDAIEKDKEFQGNRAELPQIEELLKDLRKKLQ